MAGRESAPQSVSAVRMPHRTSYGGFSMNKLSGSVITIIFFGFTSFALAETPAFTADLRGSFEVPPTDSKAKGSAELTYDESTRKLRWTITIGVSPGRRSLPTSMGPQMKVKTRKL
jgi:hypothetical protein